MHPIREYFLIDWIAEFIRIGRYDNVFLPPRRKHRTDETCDGEEIKTLTY